MWASPLHWRSSLIHQFAVFVIFCKPWTAWVWCEPSELLQSSLASVSSGRMRTRVLKRCSLILCFDAGDEEHCVKFHPKVSQGWDKLLNLSEMCDCEGHVTSTYTHVTIQRELVSCLDTSGFFPTYLDLPLFKLKSCDAWSFIVQYVQTDRTKQMWICSLWQ